MALLAPMAAPPPEFSFHRPKPQVRDLSGAAGLIHLIAQQLQQLGLRRRHPGKVPVPIRPAARLPSRCPAQARGGLVVVIDGERQIFPGAVRDRLPPRGGRTSGSSASSKIWISSGVMRVSTPRSPSASAAGLHQCEDIRAVDACWHVDHDPVPVGKLFDPCWHFSRSRQRLIAPMPLLAYLAGQRIPTVT